MDFFELKRRVKSIVGRNAYYDALDFLRNHDPRLWGELQPRIFLELNFVLTILKLRHGEGYDATLDFYDQETKLSKSSFEHNFKVLLSVLGDWGKDKVQPGSLHDWLAHARHVPRDRAFQVKGSTFSSKGYQDDQNQGVNLWMDSVDLPRLGYRKYRSRKGPRWSFKLNCPGRRYMMLRDGTGGIVYLSSGYPPKVHDGAYLEIKHDEIDAQFAVRQNAARYVDLWKANRLKGGWHHS